MPIYFTGGGGTPGGSDTQLQRNAAGLFGGISGATSDGTTLTVTSPKIVTSILDTNGLVLLGITATASAVDYLTLANGATVSSNTSGAPSLSAIGSDTNIGIRFNNKGSGVFGFHTAGPAANNDFISINSGNTITGNTNATGQRFQLLGGTAAGLRFGSDGVIAFNSGTNLGAGALDTGLSRAAAGVAQINNGTTGTLRWFNWAGEARVATQFDKTTDATLANITGLTINVLAGRSVRFEAVLYTTSNIGGGIKAAISGTATATAIVYEAVVFSAGVSIAIGTPRATALDTTVGDVTTVTVGTILITGLITVNAAGTLTVQFAQNASNGAASSVLVGSSLIAYDVP